MLVVTILLQTTIAAHVRVLGASPDFALLAVVAVGLLRGSEIGALFGFVVGVGVAVAVFGPLGLAAWCWWSSGTSPAATPRRPTPSSGWTPVLAVPRPARWSPSCWRPPCSSCWTGSAARLRRRPRLPAGLVLNGAAGRAGLPADAAVAARGDVSDRALKRAARRSRALEPRRRLRSRRAWSAAPGPQLSSGCSAWAAATGRSRSCRPSACGSDPRRPGRRRLRGHPLPALVPADPHRAAVRGGGQQEPSAHRVKLGPGAD